MVEFLRKIQDIVFLEIPKTSYEEPSCQKKALSHTYQPEINDGKGEMMLASYCREITGNSKPFPSRSSLVQTKKIYKQKRMKNLNQI